MSLIMRPNVSAMMCCSMRSYFDDLDADVAEIPEEEELVHSQVASYATVLCSGRDRFVCSPDDSPIDPQSGLLPPPR